VKHYIARFETALSQLPSELSQRLRSGLEQGVISSAEVGYSLAEFGLTPTDLMIQLLPIAAARSRSPISGFPVGAVALGLPNDAMDSGLGSIYLGANMEFPKQALQASIHAEISAVNNAWLHGEEGVQMLVVSAAPCGLCRQFLKELNNSDQSLRIIYRRISGQAGSSFSSSHLKELLPSAFGPMDLAVSDGLMRRERHDLILRTTDALVDKALDAANQSYAPYTKAFAGVALLCSTGQIYLGRYAENAAYNPSLLAMQSALANMYLSSSMSDELKITRAVLVEASNRPTSQFEVSQLLLAVVAPKVPLQHYLATVSQ